MINIHAKYGGRLRAILQESKGPKIDNILNLERVYFLVIRVYYHSLVSEDNP